jgi:DNA repair exonuclease SbcCD nuclease subunit
MRFIHAADLHIDSPLRGLERYEGAPVDDVRGATRRAFENLVDLAVREAVDMVVLAGDLFDGDWQDYNTGLFFQKGLARLSAVGIVTVIAKGNHDAQSKVTKSLKWPDLVHELPANKPKTLHFEELGVAVHGQSFASAAVTEDLAAGYPPSVPGCFNIGVLHSSLTGRPGHSPYAPTTVEVLQQRGYQYWALGHVHAREEVCRNPWIVFPGNIQGRHIRETGSKGCSLVTVEDDQVVEVRHVPLDVLRWATLKLNIGSLSDLDSLLVAAGTQLQHLLAEADGRLLAVRVFIAGTGPVHELLAQRGRDFEEDLRALAIRESNEQLWLEKIRIDTQPSLDVDALIQRDDPIGQLLRELRQLQADPAAAAALMQEAGQDVGPRLRLVPELKSEEGVDFDSAELAVELLRQAEADLLARLAGEGTA